MTSRLLGSHDRSPEARFSGLIVSGCEPKLIQRLACIWNRGASYRHVKASIQAFEQSLAARASAFVTAQQPGVSSLPEIFRAEIVQQSASLLPDLRAVFLPPRHPPNDTCRIVAGRGRCDAGKFAAVRSDEDIEGWSIGHRKCACAVRVDRIRKGAPAPLYDNVVADPERHRVSAGTVPVKHMNSRVSRLCGLGYAECGGQKDSGLREQISPSQSGKSA
jgi:hypothetical protein